MKKQYKAGLLVILLVVPASLYLFLVFFGENRYQVPKYYPKGVETKLVNGKEIQDTLYHTIPNFSLSNQYGEKVTQENVKGNIYVVDFFFTSCGNPDFCPRMATELSRVQEAFRDENTVKILSYTVDPKTDDVPTLLKYAEEKGAKKDKWYFLTGDKTAIYQLAQKGYFVTAGEEGQVVTPDFIHTSKFILVDKEGRIRGYYNGIDREEVDKLIVEIEILLAEYEN